MLKSRCTNCSKPLLFYVDLWLMEYVKILLVLVTLVNELIKLWEALWVKWRVSLNSI